MPPRVVVTGVGIISSLGRGLPDHQRMLLNEQAALGPCTLPETIYAREFPFGEVRLSNDELAFPAGIPAEGNSRTTLLGCIAAAEAIAQSGLTSPLLHRGALINASTVGGMCEVEKYYFDMLNEPEAFTAYTDTLDCADCSIRIAKRFGIQGFITTISTACSSSANALMLGARMLEQKKVPVAICGGTDALTRFTINGFNALKNIDRQACRPFDAGRNGLNLGEGAAYLVLEREEDALSRGARILAIFSGYANYNEAFHATAPNPEGEGAYRGMELALQKAGLAVTDIDYINAHGTATLTNDESESNAMIRLFGTVPAFSSTKCYTGHTLAAAGAVEAVFAVNAIEEDCVYANLNFTTPMPGSALVPQLRYETKKNIRHVMSNSFAFGGNNTSLIFSKYES